MTLSPNQRSAMRRASREAEKVDTIQAKLNSLRAERLVMTERILRYEADVIAAEDKLDAALAIVDRDVLQPRRDQGGPGGS